MNPDSTPARPVRLRQRLREATVEAILQAAERAFTEDGPKARMETIAGLAGLAVGTLYNHFADREALWAELCRSRREALLVRLDEALEASRGAPFEAALRAFLGAFAAHWEAHRGFLEVMMQAEPRGGRSPRPGARDRTMLDELLARAGRLVRRGVAAAALRDEAADLYPALLLGMLRSLLLHHLDRAPAGAAGAQLDRMIEVFLRGAGRP